MGYTTEFSGYVTIDPVLSDEEIEFLNKFADTRRMHREKGPYYVGGSGFRGQGSDDDVFNNNRPDPTQPGLWYQWIPDEEGKFLEHDGGEKFYDYVEWMKYLIDHFLKPDCLAKKELGFLQANHICNGEIKWQGEEMDDRGLIIVKNNRVKTKLLK